MLQTFELLDRFELMYPTKSKLADLRRSYIDKDLSSILRLVTDKNKEDLRKLIMEDNTWKLWLLLNEQIDTQFIAAFKSFFVNHIDIDNDCFSRGQLQSKLWLIEQLKKIDVELGTVFLCAGWYGTLATMIFESGIKVDKIRSFDIDETTVDIAETFNKPWFANQWKFKALVEDIQDINYNEHTWQYWSNKNNRMSYPITDSPDTVINTSCEHIEHFANWYAKIPNGKLVVLQSNNYYEVEEHVNCAKDAEEFSLSIPMNNCLYLGELQLEKYSRFMKIGYK
jgi:hypothetical protein